MLSSKLQRSCYINVRCGFVCILSWCELVAAADDDGDDASQRDVIAPHREHLLLINIGSLSSTGSVSSSSSSSLSLLLWFLGDCSINEKKIFWVTTQNYNVYNGRTQKAVREALTSLNWPSKQTTEHNYEYFWRNRWTDVRTGGRTGGRTEGKTNNNMCSASASANTNQ